MALEFDFRIKWVHQSITLHVIFIYFHDHYYCDDDSCIHGLNFAWEIIYNELYPRPGWEFTLISKFLYDKV